MANKNFEVKHGLSVGGTERITSAGVGTFTDLNVTGTTTTIDTATLQVQDKNIVINYGSGDTSSTASGAGITIQDAVDASNDATLLWDASADEFDFSHTVTAPSLTIAGNAAFDTTTLVVDSSNNRVGIGNASPNAFLSVRKDNNNSGNQFVVADTEGATPGLRTYTHNGDDSGLILNHYYAVGGSGNEYMRYADFVANVGDGAGTTMRFITKNAANTFTVGLAQDNNGLVGIGTTSPSKLLHIKSADPVIRLEDSSPSAYAEIDGAGGDLIISCDAGDNDANSVMQFKVDNSEKMRIDASGNMIVGGTAIQNSFSSSQDKTISIQGTRPVLELYESDTAEKGFFALNSSAVVLGGNSNTTSLQFQVDAAERMRIDASGNVGIGCTPVQPFQVRTQTDGNVVFQNSTAVTGGVKINCFNDAANASKPFEIDGSSLQFNIAATEKMRIDASGNVGIGSTTPKNVLDLGSATSGRGITFTNYSNIISEHSNASTHISSNYYPNAGAAGYKVGASGNFGAAGVRVHGTGGGASSGIIQFYADSNASKTADDAFTPTERVRINSSGAADNATLQVFNSNSNAFNHVQENLAPNLTSGENAFLGLGKANSTKNTGYVGYYFSSSGSNDNFIHLSHWASDNLFRVYGNGQISSNSIYSDRDKKENIKEVSGTSLDKIVQIPIKSFRMKQIGANTTEIRPQKTGFIAQEVQPYLPDVVSGTDGEGDMGIDTVGIIAHLVRAVKELEARITTLEG